MSHAVSGGSRDVGRRLPVVLVLIVVLVIAGLADRAGRPSPNSGSTLSTRPSSFVAPPQALSSVWYCTGGTGPGGLAVPELILANSSATATTATIREVPNKGRSVSDAVSVPARSQVHFAPPKLAGPTDYVAFDVNVAGGGVVVEQELTGVLGTTTSKCAARTAKEWYFGAGSTLVGTYDVITLFNPTPTDGVADLTFSTDQGPTTVGDFQGISVPAGSLVAVNLGDHVQTRPQIATTVKARIGRLVVGEIEESNVAGRIGIAVTLGATQLSTQWYFPNAISSPGTNESYHFYNPSGVPAQVSLTVTLDQGSSSPLTFTVPPQSQLTVPTTGQSRIPPAIVYHARVRVINHVPILAERTIGAPSGLVATIGSSVTASRWLLAQGVSPDKFTGSVVVLNPGRVPATISVAFLDGAGKAGSAPTGPPIKIAPGARLVLSSTATAAGLVISATAPVVVERDLVARGGKGLSAQMAAPAGDWGQGRS